MHKNEEFALPHGPSPTYFWNGTSSANQILLFHEYDSGVSHKLHCICIPPDRIAWPAIRNAGWWGERDIRNTSRVTLRFSSPLSVSINQKSVIFNARKSGIHGGWYSIDRSIRSTRHAKFSYRFFPKSELRILINYFEGVLGMYSYILYTITE